MAVKTRIATVSVINDLVTDHRVQKSCAALQECGYHVVLIGRQLNSSLPLPAWSFEAKRMRMLFTSGPLFYLFFNLRLFFFLLFQKTDLLYSNDLDTLAPNYLISIIKRIPLIYDSHELFCEVPELLKTPFKRKIWLGLESRIIPKLKTCITVNNSIAKIYQEKYGKEFFSIRNISEAQQQVILKSKAELGLPENKKIVLLQGAGINIDRGAEELVEAMKDLQDVLLLIIGSGDSWPILEKMVSQLNLKEKVKLIGKLPREELLQYTRHADLGVSVDKATNLNYLNSLPNKLFDYIQCGIPVLASRLPELEKIINDYQIGEFINNHSSRHISERIKEMLDSPNLKIYKGNTLKANKSLNWESEKLKLKEIILKAGKYQVIAK